MKLTRTGSADIDATNETVITSNQISCDFNLTGAASGVWNVVVTNSDTSNAYLVNCFTIGTFSGIGWHLNYHDECDVPNPNSGFVAIAAGGGWSLGLKADGSIVAWGFNTSVAGYTVPIPNSGFVALDAGSSHSLGLKANGSIVAWGDNGFGQCNVPSPNSGFVSVAAGGYHSLGLKADGSIVSWGWNQYGQCTVPSPNSGFVTVAAGFNFSLGLKADGSIVAWGLNDCNQCNVPSPNSGFVAVDSGENYSLGLKTDGSIVAWGSNYEGQCTVPSPNSGFVTVAAGNTFGLGLKVDGSIVAWGANNDGQCNVPSPNHGFTVISAGYHFSMCLTTLNVIIATPSPPEGGSVTGTGAYDQGDTVDLTAIPAANYHFINWTEGGVVVPGAGAAYSLTAETSRSLMANFSIDTRKIIASTGANGTITPSGAVTVNYGANQAFTITPNTGYKVADVVVDGTTHLGAVTTYTFTNVTSDHTITATFVIDTNTFTVNASVTGGHGTVTEATQAIAQGANATIHINPETGYHIASITDNGAAKTIANPYVITNVTAAHTVVVTFAQDASPGSTWYLAEGSTNWGFSCYISIANPNDEAVHAKLTYMTSSGQVAGPTVNMPAKSQATVYPSATLGQADFSTKVECEEKKTISVDRTMYWTGTGAACAEAHCATGINAPETIWYLPEGSSAWGFECFLLIANPNDTSAHCTVTWMIEGQAPVESSVAVPANSRSTFNMADFIGAKDASIKVTSDTPVIPERAMYRNNRREGHDSTGTAQPAADYYLAEGCTGFGFTTYVLVQNPQGTPTDVAITYQTASGPVTGPAFRMQPNSRKTINVNDTTAIPGPDPSFSTRVHGSAPIIAERAMYWNGGPDNAQVCHDSIGLDQPHTSWYLADGQSNNDAETWTLVQNPNSTAVTVDVTYLTPDGAGNVTKTETIAANSRRSFNMLDHSGISGRAAIMVTCTTAGKKIMCERAMYWFNRGAGTDTIGGYSD